MGYRFDIEHRSDGGVWVTCGAHRSNDERGLARMLVNAGEPDGPIEAGRPGRVDYRVRSLHAFAATTVEEGDRGLSVRPYRPHEKAEVTQALRNAISVRECRVQNRRKARLGSPAPECVENALAGLAIKGTETWPS